MLTKWERFKNLKEIPFCVEGEKEPILIVELPEITEAAELIELMATDLEKEYQRRLETEGPYTQYVDMPESLKKFKEWR